MPHYLMPDGRLVIDQPEIRQALVKAIDSYTAIYRKGCTPADSVPWSNRDNNEQFLMERDARRMRGDRPFVFTNIKKRHGVDGVADFIVRTGGLSPD